MRPLSVFLDSLFVVLASLSVFLDSLSVFLDSLSVFLDSLSLLLCPCFFVLASLSVGSCPCFVVRCSLFVVRWPLAVVRASLSLLRWPWFVGRGSLAVGSCTLSAITAPGPSGYRVKFRGAKAKNRDPWRMAPAFSERGLGPCFSQIFMCYFKSKLTVLLFCLKSYIIG